MRNKKLKGAARMAQLASAAFGARGPASYRPLSYIIYKYDN